MTSLGASPGVPTSAPPGQGHPGYTDAQSPPSQGLQGERLEPGEGRASRPRPPTDPARSDRNDPARVTHCPAGPARRPPSPLPLPPPPRLLSDSGTALCSRFDPTAWPPPALDAGWTSGRRSRRALGERGRRRAGLSQDAGSGPAGGGRETWH